MAGTEQALIGVGGRLRLLALQLLAENFLIELMSVNVDPPFAAQAQERLQPQGAGALRQAAHVQSAKKQALALGRITGGAFADIGDMDIVGMMKIIMRLDELL